MKDSKIFKKRTLIPVVALLMALLMVVFTGCNKDGSNNSSNSGNSIVITPGNGDSGSSSEDNSVPKLDIPDRTDKVKAAKESNDDVVGWLLKSSFYILPV